MLGGLFALFCFSDFYPNRSDGAAGLLTRMCRAGRGISQGSAPKYPAARGDPAPFPAHTVFSAVVEKRYVLLITSKWKITL